MFLPHLHNHTCSLCPHSFYWVRSPPAALFSLNLSWKFILLSTQQYLNKSRWDSSLQLFSNYKANLKKKKQNHEQKQPQRNTHILFTAWCIPGNLHWKLHGAKFVKVTKHIKWTHQSLKWELNPTDIKTNQLLTVLLWFRREFETDNGQDYENNHRPGN